MNEDETKVLDSDEPTEALEPQKAPTTQPMLQEILARINDGFAGMDQRLAAIEGEMREQRKAIHSLERRFDVYTQDLLKIRGDVLNHENRLEDLERKAS
jgi:chromosome segregation ATPase